MDHTIITGQYVRIDQTPASVGTRLLALAIDYTLLMLFIIGLAKLNEAVHLLPETWLIVLVFFIIGFYSLMCEIFNNGQTVGKRLMHLRVTHVDGSEPTIGSYLLRWLLYPVDIAFGGGLGLICVLVTKNHQRLGALAGGTMVIKEHDYRRLHVSLDEFDYLTKEYHPTYPQAADLSLEQVDIITRTLQTYNKERAVRIAQLSRKVVDTLRLPAGTQPDETLLRTLVRDYQYYALEEI